MSTSTEGHPMPDAIREVVESLNIFAEDQGRDPAWTRVLPPDHSISTHGPVFAPEQPETGQDYTFVPPDLKDAFMRGDYRTIDSMTNQAMYDLRPIFSTIQTKPDDVWASVINTADDQTYALAIAGPRSEPTGYMWVYAPHGVVPSNAPVDNGAGDDISYQSVIQIGTLSRNSKLLAISNTIWDNKILDATTAVATTTVAYFLSNYLSKVMERVPKRVAIANAIDRAGIAVAARLGKHLPVGWAANFAAKKWVARFTKGIRALVIGLLITLVLLFIADKVYRAYKICYNVYNWSPQTWIVRSWKGRNAEIDNDESFLPAALDPAAAGTIILPNGMTTNSRETIVSYASYTFVNDVRFFQGLGVGLQLERARSAGDTEAADTLRVKYDLARMKDNRIGMEGSPNGRTFNPDSFDEWFSDEHNWAPRGAVSVGAETRAGTAAIATTTSLGGRDDQFYQFDVHIGIDRLPPHNGLGGPRTDLTSNVILRTADDPSAVFAGVEVRNPVTLDGDHDGTVLKIGDEIAMPNGMKLTVLGF